MTRALGPRLDAPLVAALAALLGAIPEALHPGFYFHDDMQTQYVPVLRAVGAAFVKGTFPLRLDGTWFGGAIAGEYQHGVFSVVHAAISAGVVLLGLSPSAIATVVTLVYAAITAAGSQLLARALGVSRAFAGVVALVAALNGFNVLWGSWLPALAGFAFVPWFWWAVLRRLRARGVSTGHVALAVTTYLELAAGWHFGALMIGLVVVYSVVVDRGERSASRAVVALCPGLAAGTLLAAPALLCFVEYASAAARTDLDHLSSAWTVPVAALFGLVVPRTSSVWQVFGSGQIHPNAALANGVLPTLLVVTTLFVVGARERRAQAPLLAFAGLVLVLSLTPSVWRWRWPFRWLPLFHLVTALVAARLCDARERIAPPPPKTFGALGSSLSPWAFAAILGAALLGSPGAGFGITAAVVLGSALLVDTLGRRPGRLPLAVGAGLVANLVVTPLSGPPRDSTPGWDLSACRERLGDSGRGLRHLGIYLAETVIDTREAAYAPVSGRRGCLLPGNLGLLFDRPFVNGYSTLFPRGLYALLEPGVHGDLGRDAAREVMGAWAEQGALLDRWGVEAITAPDVPGVRERLEDVGWRRTRDLGDGHLFTREGPTQRALLEPFSPSEVAATLRETRARVVATRGRGWIYTRAGSAVPASVFSKAKVERSRVGPNGAEALVAVEAGNGPGLVLLRQPFYPGYRAELDGRRLELGAADGVFVVAEVPAGAKGRLTIEYRPLGVRWPGLLSLIAGVLLVAALATLERRERARTA